MSHAATASGDAAAASGSGDGVAGVIDGGSGAVTPTVAQLLSSATEALQTQMQAQMHAQTDLLHGLMHGFMRRVEDLQQAQQLQLQRESSGMEAGSDARPPTATSDYSNSRGC